MLLAGCQKPRDEAKPDEAQKSLPALSKPAAAQGDGTEAAKSDKPEPKAADTVDPHGPEPVRSEDQTDDDGEEEGKKHEGRRRASSGPSASRAADEAKAGPLSVKRILFSEQIDKREPVSPEETFSAKETDKVYAFVELGNATKEKSRITVAFVPPSGAGTKVDLEVGAKPRWRTWAKRSKPRAVGTWTVVVTDEKGAELGRRTFEVTE
jgi:hypothetical protein